VFDMPVETVRRYLEQKTGSSLTLWRFDHRSKTMSAGQTSRVEVQAPAIVHWSSDHWRSRHGFAGRDTGLGMYVVDLPMDEFPGGTELTFTFYWPAEDRWEGMDFTVGIQPAH
jgi:glucoamylase